MELNIKEYLKQFNVLDCDGVKSKIDYDGVKSEIDCSVKSEIDCQELSQLLYSAILNKYNITIDDNKSSFFYEYQERVFDLVENLRELDKTFIMHVFDYLVEIDVYLPDIIILLWCLPKTGKFLSHRMYQQCYQQQIKKYNSKMIEIIDCLIMKNFCIESLTKTNNIPVHCIDYLWGYMDNITIEIKFSHTRNSDYIGLTILEDNLLEIELDMEYLLRMELGRIVYCDIKGSFRNLLKTFITDIELVKIILTTNSKHHYRRQLIKISDNPEKYFGDLVKGIPNEIMELINSK